MSNKKVIKLDVKDRKILAEMYDDARKPISKIAKNVALSKEVVNYRIKRLHKDGLLVGYNTVIDIKRIGWEMFFVYVQLRRIDDQVEQTITKHLQEHHSVAWIVNTIGNHDLLLKVFARSQEQIDEIMKSIESKFQEHIDNYDIDYLSEEHAVPFAFFYKEQRKDEIHTIKSKATKPISLKKTSTDILRLIAKNARLSYAEIASTLHISRDVVRYEIEKMQQQKIILKYRPDAIPKILGYNWYIIVLDIGKMKKETQNTLYSYLMNQENITYFYRTIGNYDMEIELRVKTTEELRDILMQIRSILKTVLKKHELLTVLDESKYTYFTECLVQDVT